MPSSALRKYFFRIKPLEGLLRRRLRPPRINRKAETPPPYQTPSPLRICDPFGCSAAGQFESLAFGRLYLPYLFLPFRKQSLLFCARENPATQHRNPRYSGTSRFRDGESRKLSEFQRRELLSGSGRQMFPSGRVSSLGGVSRQAIFPLSR